MLQSIYTHAGCDYGCLYTYSPRHCFNPHTHAGCDLFVHLQCVQNMFQSTHPRRVWQDVLLALLPKKVSIHTPTQGVTLPFPYWTKVLQGGFNPHTHAGCDAKIIEPYFNYLFQSTHPRRVWHEPFNSNNNEQEFQSTHPRRVWQYDDKPCIWESRFNPHTHAGCDVNKISITLHSRMFQSTHPRRVWLYI